MTASAKTFLMFAGQAEQALALYQKALPFAHIGTITKYGTEAGDRADKIQMAELSIGQQNFILLDSIVEHDFGFTPAISIFLDFQSSEEQERTLGVLSEEGKVFMPLDNYGFSQQFTWIEDRFGVSWQLNLP